MTRGRDSPRSAPELVDAGSAGVPAATLWRIARGPEPVEAPLPPPRLLGAFDPLLHGWTDRTPVTGDHGGVVTSNGIFRPIALVEGRAVATWTLPRGHVELAPFGRLSAPVRHALAAEAADVRRFLAG